MCISTLRESIVKKCSIPIEGEPLMYGIREWAATFGLNTNISFVVCFLRVLSQIFQHNKFTGFEIAFKKDAPFGLQRGYVWRNHVEKPTYTLTTIYPHSNNAIASTNEDYVLRSS